MFYSNTDSIGPTHIYVHAVLTTRTQGFDVGLRLPRETAALDPRHAQLQV